MHAPLELVVHHRWSLPLLVELHALGGGAKLVTLAHRLQASRDSLRSALGGLAELGLVSPNPGHGHPMRPEYVLTRAGAEAAPAAAEVLGALRRLGAEEIGLRKWSLPVTRGLGEGDERFTELRARLPGVTPRALAQALRALQEARLVERRVREGWPATPVYRLTRRARVLVPLLRAM